MRGVPPFGGVQQEASRCYSMRGASCRRNAMIWTAFATGSLRRIRAIRPLRRDAAACCLRAAFDFALPEAACDSQWHPPHSDGNAVAAGSGCQLLRVGDGNLERTDTVHDAVPVALYTPAAQYRPKSVVHAGILTVVNAGGSDPVEKAGPSHNLKLNLQPDSAEWLTTLALHCRWQPECQCQCA